MRTLKTVMGILDRLNRRAPHRELRTSLTVLREYVSPSDSSNP